MKPVVHAISVALFLTGGVLLSQETPGKPENTNGTSAVEKTDAQATNRADSAAASAQSVTNKPAELKPIKWAGGRVVVPKFSTNSLAALTNVHMRASYAIGVKNAHAILESSAGLAIPECVIMGMNDIFSYCFPIMTESEGDDYIKEFERDVKKTEELLQQQEAMDNLRNGMAFLEKNKTNEGVKVTASGLQYKIIQPGKGNSPEEDDRVAIHFICKTQEGVPFSSTYRRESPAVVALSHQVKGLREALLMMKPGAKWELYVPPHLGYEDRSPAPRVGPNSTLIWELELVRVEPKEGAAPKK